MEKQICPVCKMPMIKNGKSTHSKAKLKTCERILRLRRNISIPKIKVDGKEYEMVTGVNRGKSIEGNPRPQ